MNEALEFVLRGALIGIGGSATMDLWALFLKHAFGLASLDYGLLGRWIGYLPTGRFTHDNIGKARPVPGERIIGWTAHYLIGIMFAVLLLAIWGLEWAYKPSIVPALIVGIVTIVAPFFILQPGMGAGIAASRTPEPNTVRLRNLGTHLAYALGLYVAALITATLIPIAR
jgi:hypothetical protein